jgi:hypothetical protein
MRKLILISAFVLASVSAQAGGIREQILAVNDTPATAAPAVVAAAPAPAPAPAATAQAAPTQASQPSAASRPQASRLQKPQPQIQAPALTRRQSDELKARRIAARYGVYW